MLPWKGNAKQRLHRNDQVQSRRDSSQKAPLSLPYQVYLLSSSLPSVRFNKGKEQETRKVKSSQAHSFFIRVQLCVNSSHKFISRKGGGQREREKEDSYG